MPKTRTVPNVAFAILAAVGCLINVRGKKRIPIRLARFVVLLEPTWTQVPTAILLIGMPAAPVISVAAVNP